MQVTNRQLSLFLWQNPEFMRINSKQKDGYLPGFFHNGKVTMDLSFADQYAEAPPELLFRYHTWHRLVSNEFIPRPIARNDFMEFLRNVPEWQPTYWPAASKSYSAMISQLPSSDVEDLSALGEEELPRIVRLAFQGWKNYFYEGEEINHVKPTANQMKAFLERHPHYARNYWRNIVMDVTPDYLKSLPKSDSDAVIPAKEMSPFLKAAVYNYLKESEGNKLNDWAAPKPRD